MSAFLCCLAYLKSSSFGWYSSFTRDTVNMISRARSSDVFARGDRVTGILDEYVVS